MLKLAQNNTTKNYTMKKKEITKCGYIGYEFDSGIIQMDIGSAITTAIGLMKLPIVQSVSVLSNNEEIRCKYYKDHETFNGKRIFYEDNIDSSYFRKLEYKNSIIRITTYRIPTRHLNNIIYKIDDFEELLDYLSYFFLNPVCKPAPKFGSEEMSIKDRVDLINYKDMDYKILYEPEDTDEIEDLQCDNYYEIDATLPRNEILELEKDIVGGSTRIEAITYLDEENDFLITTGTDDEHVTCPYVWKWHEEIVNLDHMLINAPTFDVDLNYFRAAIKLSIADLEAIQNLNKIKDILQYLKK